MTENKILNVDALLSLDINQDDKEIIRQQLDWLQELYDDKKAIHVISDLMDIREGSISQFINENVNNFDFTKRKNILYKYFCNENYFDVIDTEEKAYVLGFYYADGCVVRNNLVIQLSDIDTEIVEKFKKIFYDDREANYGFEEKMTPKSGIKRYVGLGARSDHMIETLNKIGLTPRKSLTANFPSEEFLPKHLQRHFIRGIFDGDGCIYLPKIGSGMGPRCLFIGSKDSVAGILDVVKREIGIELYFFYEKETKTPGFNTHNFTFANYKICKKFLDFIYKDSTIYLQRKYKKYELFLARYYNLPNHLKHEEDFLFKSGDVFDLNFTGEYLEDLQFLVENGFTAQVIKKILLKITGIAKTNFEINKDIADNNFVLKASDLKHINEQGMINEIVTLMNAGADKTKIATKYSIGKRKINNYLDNSNIKKEEKFDSTTFDNIDNEEKAYWLGYCFNHLTVDSNREKVKSDFDTNLFNNQNMLDDASSLYDLFKIDKLKLNLQKSSKNPKFEIHGKDFVKKLDDKFSFFDKSKMVYPEIDDKYDNYFIRGIFDGNGFWKTTSNTPSFTLKVKKSSTLLQEILLKLNSALRLENNLCTINSDGEIKSFSKNTCEALFNYLYKGKIFNKSLYEDSKNKIEIISTMTIR